MEQSVLDEIGGILSSLDSRVLLLDASGTCLAPSAGEKIPLPKHLSLGGVAEKDGRLFLASAREPLIIASDKQSGGDVPLMALRLCESLLTRRRTEGEGSLWYRLLTGTLSAGETESLIRENGIDDALRAVMVLQLPALKHGTAQKMLEDNLPLTPGHDVLVPLDSRTAALIKPVSAGDSTQDLMEYAEAVRETLLSEEGEDAVIAVSDIIGEAAALHAAFQHAREAMETGRTFRPEMRVYGYDALLLERFLNDIPPQTAARYHQLLFNRRTARVLTEEILDTVNMFFEKDLNLSDTARQLYIHRNTLVYRLDKIQRLTGLDLRKFDDAVTFRMLLEMKKCAEKGKSPTA